MRNRFAWAALLALALCCLQLGLPRRVFACSCAMPPTARDALNSADAVFSGTVVSVTQVNQNLSGGTNATSYPSNEVVFSVISVWKGVLRPQIILRTGSGGGDCGYTFTPGDTYLVYAYSSNPGSPAFYVGNTLIEIPLTPRQFGTSICTRTAPLAMAAADLAQLGPGTQPTQQDVLNLVLDNLLMLMAIIVALIIVIILYLLRRRRRRSFRLKP